jgi:transglutaminase-like putative cysteine protease
MRFSINYRTEYRYGGPVVDQHNVVRVRPATTPTQRVGRAGFAVEPSARVRSYFDYFGTEVMAFNIPGEHDRLGIEASADVETLAPPAPPEGSWDDARADRYVDTGGEFLLGTGDEPPAEALADLRSAIRRDSPRETLEAICGVIPERFEYRQGATFVGSTVDDLLEGGAGVCQDFVHLALILLRQEGIAARYVSGYLFAAPPDGGDNSVEVDTHAWLEALLPASNGDGPAWVGADPTNNRLASETHVKIGHGRFYGDVPPIKGVYRGPGPEAEHDVNVRMTRLR